MAQSQTYEQAEIALQTGFVDRCVGFLTGNAQKVNTPAEYMHVIEIINYQCNENDKGEVMYRFVKKTLTNFIAQQCMPKVTSVTGNDLLVAFAKEWTQFMYFARMIDKAFDWMNRVYLKNTGIPLLGATALTMFKEQLW